MDSHEAHVKIYDALLCLGIGPLLIMVIHACLPFANNLSMPGILSMCANCHFGERDVITSFTSNGQKD